MKGHIIYQSETKCIPTTSTNSDSLFNTHSTVEDWRHLEKMNFCIHGTPPRVEGGGDRLAEVVPNCLVTLHDTHSESSGKLYFPIPAGGEKGMEK